MAISPAAIRLISFAWGFAEATFFFFVPDLWLTYLVLVNRGEGYKNIPFVIAGALTGGALMYVFGSESFATARVFLDAVPAISPALLDSAGEEMRAGNALAVMQAGSLSGVPYKIYAAVAGDMGLAVPLFAFYTVIARGVRFLLVTSLASLVGSALLIRYNLRAILIVNTGCWVVFYSFYLYIFMQV